MFPMPENIFGSIGSFVGAGFNAANNEEVDQPISLSIGSFSTDGANWAKWSPCQGLPTVTIPYPSTTVPYPPIEVITSIGLPGMDSEEEIVVLPKDPIKKRNALRELLKGKGDEPVDERECRRIDLGGEED